MRADRGGVQRGDESCDVMTSTDKAPVVIAFKHVARRIRNKISRVHAAVSKCQQEESEGLSEGVY